jgi:hypothetical protein
LYRIFFLLREDKVMKYVGDLLLIFSSGGFLVLPERETDLSRATQFSLSNPCRTFSAT